VLQPITTLFYAQLMEIVDLRVGNNVSDPLKDGIADLIKTDIFSPLPLPQLLANLQTLHLHTAHIESAHTSHTYTKAIIGIIYKSIIAISDLVNSLRMVPRDCSPFELGLISAYLREINEC
jgi:hypothetical protein